MLTSSAGYSVAADGEDTAGTDTAAVPVTGTADPEDVEEYLKAREENTVFSKFTYTEYIAQYADVPDASEVITCGAADPASAASRPIRPMMTLCPKTALPVSPFTWATARTARPFRQHGR